MSLISILITTYNSEKYFSECLESALSQDFNDCEILIVDGNSTDNTMDIVRSRSDRRIRFHICESPNRSNQLNKGIELSDSEYIAILDSDDIAFPNRLSTQVNFLDQNKKIDIVGTYAYLFYDQQNFMHKMKRPLIHEKILKNLFSMNSISFPTVIFRRDITNKYKFDETLNVAEDLEWFLRVSAEYKFANIPQYLMKLRQTSESRSRREDISYIDFIDKTIKTTRSYLKLSSDVGRRYLYHFYSGCLQYYYGDLKESKKNFIAASKLKFFDPLLWRYLLPLMLFNPLTVKNLKNNKTLRNFGKIVRYLQNHL